IPMLAHLHRDVAFVSREHVNVAANMEDLDAGLLLGESKRCQQRRENQQSHFTGSLEGCFCPSAFSCSCSSLFRKIRGGGIVMFFSSSRYSGYMVSAPPRVAWKGMPYSFENS